MTDTQKMNIENMRLQGMGYKRIAKALDLSESTVKSYCQRNKLADLPKCKQCGKPLANKPKARPKTFCCSQCRYDYWNNPEQRQSARQIVCAGCGKTFAGIGNRKYCGHPCYIANRFKMGGASYDQGAI